MDISENTEISMSDQSRFGRIPDAVRRSGLCRSKIYHIAAKHEGLFLKADGATIVDLQRLDQILAALPHAKITRKRDVKQQASAA
jgi:hypothetical protein